MRAIVLALVFCICAGVVEAQAPSPPTKPHFSALSGGDQIELGGATYTISWDSSAGTNGEITIVNDAGETCTYPTNGSTAPVNPSTDFPVQIWVGTANNDTMVAYSTGPYGDFPALMIAWGGYDTVVGSKNNDVIVAEMVATQIAGGNGDDRIWGDADDVIYGEDGDDKIVGDKGVDAIDGGEGNDTIWANPLGQMVATGGEGSDVLVGGLGDDWMMGGSAGGGDSDTVYGKDGGDHIMGGNGPDFLYGGDGDDPEMYGLDGADVITGGLGDEANITGDAGSDTISGDSGNDTIHGGEDSDAIWCGDGYDLAYGGDGEDFIDGEGEPDVLYGEAGSDQVQDISSVRDDVLDGGSEDDKLNCFDDNWFSCDRADGGTGNPQPGRGDIMLDFAPLTEIWHVQPILLAPLDGRTKPFEP
jgi:Ca2+-binding RTX toxin-like protein